MLDITILRSGNNRDLIRIYCCCNVHRITGKNDNNEKKIDFKISLLLAAGSITGGPIGKGIFNFHVVNLGLADMIGTIQSRLLAFLLIIIYVYFKWNRFVPSYKIANKAIIFSNRLLLGLLSAFLGIGGGPLNVAILVLFFSMTGREIVINSICIIVFS